MMFAIYFQIIQRKKKIERESENKMVTGDIR